MDWSYCLLLLATTVVASSAAPGWARPATSAGGARPWPSPSSALLGLLGWFKYYGFVSVNVDNVTHAVGLGRAVPLLQVTLPVAISFFTFMAISYVVDVYRGSWSRPRPSTSRSTCRSSPTSWPGRSCAATSCCPRSAGAATGDAVDYSRAFWLIMAGLFKKVVISSYVSTAIVKPVFTSPTQHSAPEAIFAAWGYAVQIYCDFSGYTDIAIGLALLLGFRFPVNFDAPYTARNLQDFWRRWHMTLSRWLRDYLYIPLGGSAGERGPDGPQHHDHHGAGRPLARGGVDVRGLGGAARGRAGRRPPAAASRVRRGLPAVAEGPVRVWVQRFLTFQFVCLGWVFFNAVGHVQRLRRAGPPLQRMGDGLAAGHAAAGRDVLGTIARSTCPRSAWSACRRPSPASEPSCRSACSPSGLLGVTTFGPVGVAPFIYYRF